MRQMLHVRDAPAVRVVPQSHSRLSPRHRSTLTFYLFVSPWLVSLVLFHGGPLLATAVLSLFDWPTMGTPAFIGVANYVRAFTQDPSAWSSFFASLRFAVSFVPINLALSFLLAVLLNQSIRGRDFFRAAIYLPYIIPVVAASWVLKYSLSTNFGLINYLLDLVNLPAIPWLTSEAWAPWTLVFISVWGSVGPATVINLAGLQSIDSTLYEAATIDGAGAWSQLRFITLPLLMPTLFFNLVIGLITGLQVFGVAYLITGGGPGTSTLYLGYKLFNEAFVNFRMGYASTLAWLQFLVIAALTALIFNRARTQVHYAGK